MRHVRAVKKAPAKKTAKKTAAKKKAAKKTPAKASAKPPAKKPGGRKMKAYASFDIYLADQSPGNQRVLRALRAFVRRTVPALEESVKWGNGCWVKDGAPVSFAYSAEDHVQFGFFRGAALSDPRRLLEGRGAYVRHVKLRRPADIDEKALAALLREAAR